MTELVRILKYPVELGESVSVVMTTGSILALQMQRDMPTLWAEANGDAETRRWFRWIATGQTFVKRSEHYVGTIQTQAGFVFHLYEEHEQ